MTGGKGSLAPWSFGYLWACRVELIVMRLLQSLRLRSFGMFQSIAAHIRHRLSFQSLSRTPLSLSHLSQSWKIYAMNITPLPVISFSNTGDHDTFITPWLSLENKEIPRDQLL
jgi:hypothetical protein